MQSGSNSGGSSIPGKPVVDLDSNDQVQCADWYVRKLLSQKPIKLNVINGVLRSVWARFGKVTISERDAGVLLFDFEK